MPYIVCNPGSLFRAKLYVMPELNSRSNRGLLACGTFAVLVVSFSMAMAAVVPVQKGNKRDVFQALCDVFNIDSQAMQLFMMSPMKDLEEFQFFFTAEQQIGSFVAQAKGLRGPALRMQVARVRRAWAAMCAGSLGRQPGKVTINKTNLLSYRY